MFSGGGEVAVGAGGLFAARDPEIDKNPGAMMSHSPASSLEEVADYLECAICLARLRDPRMLPCQHTFCSECLTREQARHAGGRLPCPSCRQEHTPLQDGDFPRNRLVVQLLETLDEQAKPDVAKCEECDVQPDGEGFCEECKQYLCGPCIEIHKRSRRGKDHTILALPVHSLQQPQACSTSAGKWAALKREPLCQTHQNQRMEVYCADHHTVVCCNCAVLAHRKCNYFSLEEVSASKVKEVKAQLANLQDTTVAPLKEAVRLNREEEQNSVADMEVVNRLIEDDFEEMKAALEISNARLKQEVAEKREGDRAGLKRNLRRITADLRRAQQVDSAAEELVMNFNGTDIMSRADATLADIAAVQEASRTAIELGSREISHLDYTKHTRSKQVFLSSTGKDNMACVLDISLDFPFITDPQRTDVSELKPASAETAAAEAPVDGEVACAAVEAPINDDVASCEAVEAPVDNDAACAAVEAPINGEVAGVGEAPTEGALPEVCALEPFPDVPAAAAVCAPSPENVSRPYLEASRPAHKLPVGRKSKSKRKKLNEGKKG